MAEWMAFVKKENVKKAENALRTDFDVAAKQSITVKDARSLGMKEEGSFFYISGTEEGIKRCQELIKGMTAQIDQKHLDKAREEIKKEEEAAAEGMGGIFG
ncbi:MAG: hypothetical protein QXU82_03205 [Candidatus Aenigmatarchaeota archaeon]